MQPSLAQLVKQNIRERNRFYAALHLFSSRSQLICRVDNFSFSFAAVYGAELLFSLNNYSSLVTQQMLLSGMVLLHVVTFCSAIFFNSLCFQHILRNMRLTFWKISIGLNFTSLTRNDEKSDLWPWKLGVNSYTS